MSDPFKTLDYMVKLYELLALYRNALIEIRDMDYRGNRSQEQEIAFKALNHETPTIDVGE